MVMQKFFYVRIFIFSKAIYFSLSVVRQRLADGAARKRVTINSPERELYHLEIGSIPGHKKRPISLKNRRHI